MAEHADRIAETRNYCEIFVVGMLLQFFSLEQAKVKQKNSVIKIVTAGMVFVLKENVIKK